MKPVGYPFSPKICEKANCGPTVLASLLGIKTDEAIKIMDETYPKGWNGYTNVGHIQAALKHYNIKTVKTKGYDNIKNFTITTFPQKNIPIFLQIEGPWLKSKYWRDAYIHTHWVLVHGARILDVNNRRLFGNPLERPRWEWIDYWEDEIMPQVVDSFDNATGWHVRSAYSVEEMKL